MRQATESIQGASEPIQIPTGTIVGERFRVESLLAREGGSAVYRATDEQSGAPLALRIVPRSAINGGGNGAGAEAVDRLVAAVEKTQALRHKNLVDVEAVGREGDYVFVASEFVDGQSLREFIDGKRAEGRGVSLKGASNLVAHVANALDYAKRVTVHGALNPGIIWVNRAGRVKVSGLGLSRGMGALARHGAPAGAPDTVYVAPEVLGGSEPTTMSDVYSLGVVLYELLTGQPPGSPLKPASTIAAEVPAAVDIVIERALRRDPDARWPSATAMKDALQAAAGFAPAVDARGGATAAPAVSVPAMSLVRPTGAANATARPSPQPVAAARSTAAAPAAAAATATAGAAAATGVGAARAPVGAAGAGPQMAGPVAAPVGGPEDTVERWLVQKDRLDFGPFSMTQVRSQIERGEILPDHILIDNDSGARCKVKEYPGLRDLAKHAHRRLEQVRRAQAEQHSVKSEKKKSLATTMVIGLVVVAVLGGVGFYVLSRGDSADGRLASREEEAEIESFLKGVKISGLKASVRRAGAKSGSPASGGAAEDFNNDSNFGDVSKGFAEGDQTLDDGQIQDTMMANYRKLIPCIAHSGVNEVAMEFVVRGTGKVSAVKVNGQRTGTLPGCLLGRMQSFNFPKFNGSKTIASWSMSMGR